LMLMIRYILLLSVMVSGCVLFMLL